MSPWTFEEPTFRDSSWPSVVHASRTELRPSSEKRSVLGFQMRPHVNLTQNALWFDVNCSIARGSSPIPKLVASGVLHITAEHSLTQRLIDSAKTIRFWSVYSASC